MAPWPLLCRAGVRHVAWHSLTGFIVSSAGWAYYSLRAGRLLGFVAGIALLFSYTIDIALFAVLPLVHELFPSLRQRIQRDLGPFTHLNPLWCLEAIFIIAI